MGQVSRVNSRPGDDIATMRWSRFFKGVEMEAFEAFVVATHNLTARWVMLVCLNGRTFENCVVQLNGEPPTYTTPAAGIMRVSFTLVVMPASMTPV